MLLPLPNFVLLVLIGVVTVFMFIFNLKVLLVWIGVVTIAYNFVLLVLIDAVTIA